MIIRHGQQLGLTLGQPLLRRRALALRTMAIAAGIVGDERVRAVLATRDMAAERRRAAALDGGHHLQLAEADVTGIGSAPRRTVAAENIRNLKRGTGH